MELTQDEKKAAERGGQLIKILSLAGSPGMDEVAIKLNCGLTWDERERAERWFKAFKLGAISDRKLFDLASELYKGDR
jgi:hypothetical protein